MNLCWRHYRILIIEWMLKHRYVNHFLPYFSLIFFLFLFFLLDLYQLGIRASSRIPRQPTSQISLSSNPKSLQQWEKKYRCFKLCDADQSLVQDPQPGNAKTLLTDHLKDHFYEGEQWNFDACLGRSVLC